MQKIINYDGGSPPKPPKTTRNLLIIVGILAVICGVLGWPLVY